MENTISVLLSERNLAKRNCASRIIASDLIPSNIAGVTPPPSYGLKRSETTFIERASVVIPDDGVTIKQQREED